MSRISQQTFDSAVQENIDEFLMSAEEAVEDAIKQFKSQGVNLQNIITNSLLTNEVDVLTEKVDNVKKLIENDPTDAELVKILNDVRDECDSNLAKRVLAAQCGLYDVLVSFLTSHASSAHETLKVAVFESLIALVTGYPDLLDAPGLKIIENNLKDPPNESLLILTLKWSIECCIKHESNRERFLVNENIISGLRSLMEKETLGGEVLRLLCKLFQTFVLSDDIRTELPLAHKHACQICNDFLSPLIVRLQKYKTDRNVLIAVTQALTSIIVRNEYCQHFYDANGLDLLRDILLENLNDEPLCRSCLGLLKVVAGNDQVKAKIMEVIDSSILISVIQKYEASAKTCSKGLAALNMISLRNNKNCELLRQANVAELIIQAMKIHSDTKKLLKNVCWLIKNLAQGNEQVATDFLTLGAEECLRDILQKHEDCKFEANVALRLLKCDVECLEPWTGEGKGITN